jgi:DNA polymerase III subunit beta
MKIECIKEKISQAVSKAEKITGKNLTLPVLGCILLEAGKNNLIVKATNLDLGIEISIPAKVDNEGTIAVPGTVLSQFISNLYDNKNIKLEQSEGNLIISTQNNKTIIKALNHDDFPTIPKIEDGKSFSVAAQDFIKGLRSVWYSSATSSMKPELSSIFIYPDGENMVFVATDSFRLAEKKIKMKKAKDFNQILIPFRNIPEIIRVFEEVKDDLEVKLNKNQISFSRDGVYLTSRVVDGVFPDYKQIIPKEFKTEAVVLKQDFINYLKLANIFSDNFHQVNFRIDPRKKFFEIKTRNLEVGENVNKVDGAFNGETIDINFNHKFIIDCFQSIDSDSISLQFGANNKPMVVRGISDKSFLYLVMPMNK